MQDLSRQHVCGKQHDQTQDYPDDLAHEVTPDKFLLKFDTVDGQQAGEDQNSTERKIEPVEFSNAPHDVFTDLHTAILTIARSVRPRIGAAMPPPPPPFSTRTAQA